MENMAYEVVDAIECFYEEDKELVKDCLFYLYHTTTDNKIKSKIEKWFDNNSYCIECGSELKRFDWEEVHDELEDCPRECFISFECPYCDSIKTRKEKEYF